MYIKGLKVIIKRMGEKNKINAKEENKDIISEIQKKEKEIQELKKLLVK